MSTCGACGAAIEFALYGTKHGRRTPIDAGEFRGGSGKLDGALEVIGRHGLAPVVRSVPAHERADRMLRRSHFATCTDPDRFRKRR